jgi:RNA 3'-terminal phosphate cyclase-like protein
MAAAAAVAVFEGPAHLRQRLCLAALSGKAVRFRRVRADDLDAPGLREHEVSFLRLMDKVCNGSAIEIDHTGTDVFFRPGVLTGGRLSHDCPPTRAIGYFVEAMAWIAPFCKKPLVISLTGITNDAIDPCVRAETLVCGREGVGVDASLGVCM